MSDVGINAYAQWVSIKLENEEGSKSSYKIQNVYLKWGKFYADGNKDHELGKGSIEGQVVAPGQDYQIYSCGRSDAASGTEGGFDLVDVDTKLKIRSIYWDCPWGKKSNTFKLDGLNKKWIVENDGGNYDSGALGSITVDAYKKGH